MAIDLILFWFDAQPVMKVVYDVTSALRTDAALSIVTGSRGAPTDVRTNTVDTSSIPWAVVCRRMAFIKIFLTTVLMAA